jgi:aminoglycoside/choline kinase family phosphotransferase
LHDLRRDDPRLDQLCAWLSHDLGIGEFAIAPASADASFRRYFRVSTAAESRIVMDAPPDREDVAPYLAITDMLAQMGVHAPRVLARNAEQGFLLVTDLGSITYLTELADPVRADPLYGDALDALVRIQRHGDPHAERLPPYDEKLLRFEMSLFPDWFVGRHLRTDPRQPAATRAGGRLRRARRQCARSSRARSCTATTTPGTSCITRATTPASSTSRMRCTGRLRTTWSRCCVTATWPGLRARCARGHCIFGSG